MFRKGAHPSKTRHLTKPLYQVSKGFENLYFWFSTFFVLSGQPCRIWTDVKGLLNDVVFNWLLKLPNMVVIKLWGGLEGGQHITPSNRRRIKKGLLYKAPSCKYSSFEALQTLQNVPGGNWNLLHLHVLGLNLQFGVRRTRPPKF